MGLSPWAGLPPPPWATRLGQPSWHPAWNQTEIPTWPVDRTSVRSWQYGGGAPTFVNTYRYGHPQNLAGPRAVIGVLVVAFVLLGPILRMATQVAGVARSSSSVSGYYGAPTSTSLGPGALAAERVCNAALTVAPVIGPATSTQAISDGSGGPYPACSLALAGAAGSMSFAKLSTSGGADALVAERIRIAEFTALAPPGSAGVHRVGSFDAGPRFPHSQAVTIRGSTAAGAVTFEAILWSGSEVIDLVLTWQPSAAEIGRRIDGGLVLTWAGEVLEALGT